jgi:hypothetical protein
MKNKSKQDSEGAMSGNRLVEGNPILPGRGVCDPQVRVYGDRVYLYATHDKALENEGFRMDDWWVWSSGDLLSWKHECTVRPEETYYGQACGACWATDAISRNGKFYFYFSRGPFEIGVMVSDTPAGPWSDPLKRPLIAEGSTPTEARDPGILVDDDGTAYIVFGTWEFYIARLNEDMISLAETPRHIDVDTKMGPYGPGKMDDKAFLHKRGELYYLSWGCFYATAKNVYGPYTYKASIVVEERVAPEFQKALVMDRHASFFDLHGQSYFICNDQSFPGSTHCFRNSVIAYVHYRDNGDIDPVFIDRAGVGQYDARSFPLQAENYFKADGATKKECPAGGFEMRDLRRGSSLLYPNVMNVGGDSAVSFRVSSGNPAGGTIEVRAGSPGGELLGACRVPDTGGWTNYKTVSCDLKNRPGKLDVCLVFTGGEGEILRLDWFGFNGAK